MKACRKPRLLFVLLSAGLLHLCAPDRALRAQVNDAGIAGVPSQTEQDAILEEIRNYAAQYISHLPNFVCAQVTQQFEAGRRPTHWKKGDTLQFRLLYNDGDEERSIELVNDKPPTRGMQWRGPLLTEGEFGKLLGSVFGMKSGATFTWHGWDTLAGKRLAVFDFTIDRAHSTMTLSLSDLARSIVPYHGTINADPATGQVWRISNSLFDIPPEVRTRSLSTVIEYREVLIGATKYLLPAEATVLVDTGSNNLRNEIWFKEYRKFETDSSVTYKTDDRAAEPRKPDPPQEPQ